ncbi:magnesium transporter [Niabella drilacis]|uniref:Magnesium transporter MgtE n=1 Tax=Niabella drilacis (strain DSM 25811 / CCM 8410 / CCUG 62505 / LMG 26954 / E90) TaxID=1285928 RepID=A0A1G6TT13_NIADE|nr:magnesium transporter [Niabella drilacis]SDD32169.1 magnesium transporter [Niabella drilacis]
MSFEEEDKTLVESFKEVIATEDKLEIKKFLDAQNITDVVDLVYEMPEYDSQIIANMSVHRAASVFKLLETSNQKDIIHKLPPNKAAELLNDLPADDRTDFLEELPSNGVRELIKLLDPQERKITLSLLGYPENSIGRLMNPDYVYVYSYNTVAEVFDIIRKYGKNSDAINVIYVINHKGELLDDIRIGEFILNTPDTLVSDLMDERRVISLNAYDDQETASEVFKMNNRIALPVVSQSNKLLGIVTIDDVLWVATEEYSEDMQKMGGTQAFEEPYLDIALFKLYKKRVGWLIILFLSEMLTATAMQFFEVEIEKATLLALFVPLIMSSGGNSGSQASTLIIQAMTLGEVTIADWWRVMRRELFSGAMLGLTLGTIGLLRIMMWQQLHLYDYGPHWLLVGITIFFTLIGIVLWGSLIGSMLPIVLKRLKLDPATSSAPFVATLVDVTGIIIYFSVAYMVLKGTLL